MAKQTTLFHCAVEFECNAFTLKASVFRPYYAENATITGHFDLSSRKSLEGKSPASAFGIFA